MGGGAGVEMEGIGDISYHVPHFEAQSAVMAYKRRHAELAEDLIVLEYYPVRPNPAPWAKHSTSPKSIECCDPNIINETLLRFFQPRLSSS